MRRSRRWRCIHRIPRGGGSSTAISCWSNCAAARWLCRAPSRVTFAPEVLTSRCSGSATLAGGNGAGINAVTAKAFCPASKQPELKHAAVRIVNAELPWKLVAFGFPSDTTALVSMRDEARVIANTFDYASVVLIGGERAGLLVHIASA